MNSEKNEQNSIYDPKFVKKLFNQMSGSYERMNYITSFGFCIRWRRQLFSKFQKSNKNLQVIDLLSGLGENWTFMRHHFPNANFHALDFSDEMVLQSRAKAQKLFPKGFTLLQENILQNSLKTNYFDIITCAYGLKTFNTKQLELLAKEICRILKPGGQFSFVEVSIPKNKILLYPYRFYLSRIIPKLGKLFAGNKQDYKMLWIYTEKYKNSDTVQKIFEQNGLLVSKVDYFGGCASGIYGSKRSIDVTH